MKPIKIKWVKWPISNFKYPKGSVLRKLQRQRFLYLHFPLKKSGNNLVILTNFWEWNPGWGNYGFIRFLHIEGNI